MALTGPLTSPAPTPLGPSAETATSRQRTAGLALLLGASASNQVGAGLGAMAFPVLGPIGVVAVRQIVTALVLVPVVRPPLRGMTRAQWLPVLGLVAVFSLMNLCLYAAVERIGLGLAMTLEFLGPLTVAILGARSLLSAGCALLAAAGVAVIAQPGPTTDVLGIALALVAATAWGFYILLNRSLGQRLPGLQGTALASLVAGAIWVPVAAWWFVLHPPTATALLLAAACGLLASVIPYAADMVILRRVPATLFGTLSSVAPIWAGLAGWVMLGERLDLAEWTGIALIVAANVLVTTLGTRRATSIRRRRMRAEPNLQPSRRSRTKT